MMVPSASLARLAGFVALAALASPVFGLSGDPSQITLIAPAVVQGTVGGGTVTHWESTIVYDNASGNWSDGAFSGEDGPHYLELTSGAYAGLTFDIREAFAPGEIELWEEPGFHLVGNESFVIRPHHTLSSFLDDAVGTAIQAGPNSVDADTVLVWDPMLQSSRAYFYSDVENGWLREDFEPADDLIIYPEQGLMVMRSEGAATSFLVTGTVPDQPLMVPVEPGYNLVGTLQSAEAMQLTELRLGLGEGFAPADNPTDGDTLVLVESNGVTTTYFYSERVGFEGWYDAAYNAADEVEVPAGSAFFIHRKAGPAFLWTVGPNSASQ